MNYVIGIDHLPDRNLNPNKLSHQHWIARSKASWIALSEAYYKAKELGIGKPIDQYEIEFTFSFKDKRKHDLDNLQSAAKPWIDGLVKAGVLAGDDARHMRRVSSVPMFGDKEEYTLIRITPIVEKYEKLLKGVKV
jgi:Holliday junction resolvase RusA-like endonuclease